MNISKDKYHYAKFKANVPHCYNYYREHVLINCYTVLVQELSIPCGTKRGADPGMLSTLV